MNNPGPPVASALARAEIADCIDAHFFVGQLDLWGARVVTDFDGGELEARGIDPGMR